MNARERAEEVVCWYVSGDKTTLVWLIEGAITAAEEGKAKEERDAIIKTAEERRETIQDYMQDLDRDSMNYKIATIQVSEIGHMVSTIRARSESEKKEKGE